MPTPVCGFASANFCGGCTADAQCAAGQICVTAAGSAQGTCGLANAAGCGAGQSDVVCPLNASDECCNGSCYPGNCCVVAGAPSGCTGANISCAPDSSRETTGGGVCTVCAAVSGSNPVYYVDPVHGSDSQGTGNNRVSSQCAFQTITRALQLIGASPQPNTTIDIVGNASAGVVTINGVATGTALVGQERFPLTIRANITVTNSGGPVTVEVPARAAGMPTTGFVMAGQSSAIVGGAGGAFVIDGNSRAATTGVSVQGPGAMLSAVTVQNFAVADVQAVNAGSAPSSLVIGPGVQCVGSASDGLLVSGGSSAAVTGSPSQPTLFNGNGAHGIRVIDQGILTLTGAVGANPPSSGTVVAVGNGAAGVWMETTAATPSTIAGVVSTGSTSGNGLRIIPSTNVKVRNSWFLGNSKGSGIDIENNGNSGTAVVSGIDLGSGTTGAAAGGNTLQATSGHNPNGSAGICMRLPTGGAPPTLVAEGNVFQGADCATTAHALVARTNFACAGGVDIGGTLVATGAAGDHVDVLGCIVP